MNLLFGINVLSMLGKNDFHTSRPAAAVFSKETIIRNYIIPITLFQTHISYTHIHCTKSQTQAQ